MNKPDHITNCPSTLQQGYDTYSPAAQDALFGSRSKKVSHVLPFGPPGKNAELTKIYNEKRKNISISDRNNSWDGSYNGEQLPAGAYVYSVQTECEGGDVFEYRGTVMILR